MRMLRSLRFSLMVVVVALVAALIPASSHAAVFVSVGFAPPVLPVYVQPPCPEPGWMWTPGYWAYGPDGYYWVPGTWVPAPYVGALWTPGYWGWSAGLYVWHPGYWGPHVGYYGGVNYGFGFFGIGFVGGVWHGGVFAYNTAVVHVNTTVIRNTYVDRTIIRGATVAPNSRVAFSGGPGGIRHAPTAQENAYSREGHMGATPFQTQHQNAAMHNTNAYFSHNGGHPANPAVARPMGGNAHGGPRSNITVTPPDGIDNRPRNTSGNQSPAPKPEDRSSPKLFSPANRGNPGPQQGGRSNYSGNNRVQSPQARPAPQSHPAPQQHESHPAPQQQGHEKGR